MSADEGSIPGLSELLQGSVLGHVEDLFDHDDASVPSLPQGTGDGDRAALADCMLISSNMHRPVELRLTDRGPGSEPPVTVVQLFQQAVERHAAKRALCVKRAGEWKTWTYQKYYDDSVALARAFIKVSVVRSSPHARMGCPFMYQVCLTFDLQLGLQPCHGVCILGFNSPEWFIANMAAIMAG